MDQNILPVAPSDETKKSRRGRPPKAEVLLKENDLLAHRTVVPIAPYPSQGNYRLNPHSRVRSHTHAPTHTSKGFARAILSVQLTCEICYYTCKCVMYRTPSNFFIDKTVNPFCAGHFWEHLLSFDFVFLLYKTTL